jgi:hypothetical protein
MPAPLSLQRAVTGRIGATVAPQASHECVTDNCEFAVQAVRSGRHEPLDQPRPREANGAEAQRARRKTDCRTIFFVRPAVAVYARVLPEWRGADSVTDAYTHRVQGARTARPAHAPKRDNIPNVCGCFAPRSSSSGV